MYLVTYLKKILNAAAILWLAAFLFSCKNDIEEIQSFDKTEEVAQQSAHEIEIIYSDSAQVKLKIIAPYMERFDADEEKEELARVIFPKGIHVLFFGNNLTVNTDLKANYAIHYESENLWEVRNNVVIVNQKGEVINSEEMIWNQKEGTVHSDKYVKVETENEIIMGTGFESDENFINYTILNPTGIINLEEE